MATGFWTRGIDPGSFRKSVTFYRQSDKTDDLGKVTNGLVKVATLRADFYPIRGKELLEVQKVQGEVTHKCYCRYNSKIKDIDSNWYLEYEGKKYSIESAVDGGCAKRYFEIYCTAHVNAEDMPEEEEYLEIPHEEDDEYE